MTSQRPMLSDRQFQAPGIKVRFRKLTMGSRRKREEGEERKPGKRCMHRRELDRLAEEGAIGSELKQDEYFRD